MIVILNCWHLRLRNDCVMNPLWTAAIPKTSQSHDSVHGVPSSAASAVAHLVPLTSGQLVNQTARQG